VNAIFVLLILGIGLWIYFIPAIIAGKRNHHAVNAIIFVNLIAGWTLLGWVACLIWAYSNEKTVTKQTIVNKSELSVADEIKKLANLKDEGLLTEDEFNIKKQKLLNT
jgi:hypothetical protein